MALTIYSNCFVWLWVELESVVVDMIQSFKALNALICYCAMKWCCLDCSVFQVRLDESTPPSPPPPSAIIKLKGNSSIFFKRFIRIIVQFYWFFFFILNALLHKLFLYDFVLYSGLSQSSTFVPPKALSDWLHVRCNSVPTLKATCPDRTFKLLLWQ